MSKTMKPIPIPGAGDVTLHFGDQITLDFLDDGDFQDFDPSSFSPSLPNGHVKKGNTGKVYTAARHIHDDRYKFTSKGQNIVTMHTIHITNTVAG